MLVLSGPASAAQYTYQPISDADDGQLVNGSTWDEGPSDSTVPDLLLNLGQEGKNTYDICLAFTLADLAEGAFSFVEDAYVRFGEQGGIITNSLTVEISAALDLDPLAATGLARFSLPRTTNKVSWNIAAAWDSSGQRMAKWEQSPNLAPIINELLTQPGWDASPKAGVFFLELDSAFLDNVVRFDDTHGQYAVGGNAGMRPAELVVNQTFHDAFWGKELLCRPKPTSMGVNIIPHADTDASIQWGLSQQSLDSSTGTMLVPGGTAHEFRMTNLVPDTQYWYRMLYRPAGGGPFQFGPTRTFVTLPIGNAEARVCITSDIHVTNTEALGLSSHLDLLDTTLLYMEEYLDPKRFHLWVDLGDLVVIRAQRVPFDLEDVEQRYRRAREYIDVVGHSLPFVFVRGNHEETNGWDFDGTPNNTAVWSGNMLLKYFPPPLPDSFYSGNENPFPHIGLPGDYFAFDVGNLRIRALDPFLYSTARPHNGHGETGGSLNGWDWRLGDDQYLWLYDDLVQNPTPFSLLAVHHLTSCYTGVGKYYGRGGTEIAKFSVDGRPSFEWGGEDSTGTDMLTAFRPGYVHGAVHDMLVNNGNQVLVKGHDHFHGRQDLDGMYYVTLAKPDDTGEQTGNLWGWRFFSHYPQEITFFEQNSGFINLSVTGTVANYEYIQTYPASFLGTILDSFSVLPAMSTSVTGPTLPTPRRTSIRAVMPNPARVYARLEYEVALKGTVRLSIHDAGGRLVRELVNEHRPAGVHSVLWDGRDRNGRRVASGAYFAKLQTEKFRDAVKMVVLR